MKTKQEIQDEIDAAKRTIENYRKEYKEGDFPKDQFKKVLLVNESVILALKWVLEENKE